MTNMIYVVWSLKRAKLVNKKINSNNISSFGFLLLYISITEIKEFLFYFIFFLETTHLFRRYVVLCHNINIR